MQYYFDGDSNLYEYGAGDKPFSTPDKTKQMGGIESYMKLYMEDYVYTYLYQYGRSGGGKEKLAALVGRHYVVDGQDTLVISGAIQAKGTVQQNGVECFSEETWEYIGGQMETYFKGLSILGWVHCQPGFGTFLMARDETFHREYFKEKWQVLFAVDTVDKMDVFYLYNEDGMGLRQARGYFIYYDKNEEMQEYMLENSMVRPKEMNRAEIEEQSEQAERAVEPRERRRRKPTPEERMDAAREIRRTLQKRAQEAEQEKKGQYVMLAGVSCALCVVCLCMGLAMLRSLNRLQVVETELVAMRDSYYALAEDFEDVKVQNVFAAEDTSARENGAKAAETAMTAETAGTSSAAQSAGREVQVYKVESGDSVAYISRKFYGDTSGIERIIAANDLQNADLIYEGQALLIP